MRIYVTAYVHVRRCMRILLKQEEKKKQRGAELHRRIQKGRQQRARIKVLAVSGRSRGVLVYLKVREQSRTRSDQVNKIMGFIRVERTDKNS